MVYPYHPEISCCPLCYMLPPASVITNIMTKFIPMFSEIAKKYGLPIIDLSRTLNPFDSCDYGSTPIEASICGGNEISDLIT